MSSKLTRFTERVVPLAQKAVAGDPDPAFQEGEDGYADWVIVAIHGLREYLNHTYRRLLDVLHEMHGIVDKLGVEVTNLPDYTTVYTRKHDLEMRLWRVLLRLSGELPNLDKLNILTADKGYDWWLLRQR